MARKRMFDIEIINQDSFFDLPMEAKALYFLLGMEADDEGFVSPKKILRLYGGTEDSIKVLIAKNYIIPFKTGVVVITDWKRNNYIDKNRIKETIYQDEKKQLLYNEETEKYEVLSKCSTDVKQMLNQNSIDKNRLDKNRIEYNNIVEQVIDYLNLKTGKHFKSNTNNTVKHIKARLNEGYSLEELKKVIDTKTLEWLNNKDMNQYLRPDTLFGSKFESYLNQQQRTLTTKDLAPMMDFESFINKGKGVRKSE